MGILKTLVKSTPPSEGIPYEIVERRLSVDTQRFQVRVKKAGREFYAEELFYQAKKPGDLTFSRFFLLNENPPRPHFAPSLAEAVDWFQGRKQPKDGYGTIWWGDRIVIECSICRAGWQLPLRITAVERLTVATAIPTPREIVGWRVAEVESELTGKGAPSRRLEEHKLKAVVIWDEAPNQYLCSSCARKLADAGRPPDPDDYFIFEA